MVNEADSSGTPSAEQSLQDEVHRLRSQVKDLQAEVSRRKTGSRSTAAASRLRRDQNDLDDDYQHESPRKYNLSPEAERVARDLPFRAVDEFSKLTRGLAFASLEQLRVFSEVVDIFTQEVFNRNQPARYSSQGSSESSDSDETGPHRKPRRRDEDPSTVSALASGLPGDIYSGAVLAFNEALSRHSRVIDRFHDTYRESNELDPERSGTEGRPSRRREAVHAREAGGIKTENEKA